MGAPRFSSAETVKLYADRVFGGGLAFIGPVAIFPIGILAFKFYQNRTSVEDTNDPEAGKLRKRSVVDRLCSGPTPPVSFFSEKHLEKMIKTNSAMREYADVLRAARTKALSGTEPNIPTEEQLEKIIKANSVLQEYKDGMHELRAHSCKPKSS